MHIGTATIKYPFIISTVSTNLTVREGDLVNVLEKVDEDRYRIETTSNLKLRCIVGKSKLKFHK